MSDHDAKTKADGAESASTAGLGRCPIGMDDHYVLCSVRTCNVCRLNREAEALARADVGDGIDWRDPANLGATAPQRATFRRGYIAGAMRPNAALTGAAHEK